MRVRVARAGNSRNAAGTEWKRVAAGAEAQPGEGGEGGRHRARSAALAGRRASHRHGPGPPCTRCAGR